MKTTYRRLVAARFPDLRCVRQGAGKYAICDMLGGVRGSGSTPRSAWKDVYDVYQAVTSDGGDGSDTKGEE